MITFPIDLNCSLIVIEPANVERMKKGRPLKVGEHIVCFTPDIQKFIDMLEVPVNTATLQPGERVEYRAKIATQKITKALEVCQDLPEVLR